MERTDGSILRYDPRFDLAYCSVYERREMKVAVGDRIQLTAPFNAKGLCTRDTGIVRSFDGGKITIETPEGRFASWDIKDFRHIDYAYVWTSHASQSVTNDKCVVNIEANNSNVKKLLNRVFGYVSWSRAAMDLAIYTDDKEKLVQVLSQELEKHTTMSPDEIKEFAHKCVLQRRAPQPDPEASPHKRTQAPQSAPGRDNGKRVEHAPEPTASW